jgi:acyl-CoA thioesterase-1
VIRTFLRAAAAASLAVFPFAALAADPQLCAGPPSMTAIAPLLQHLNARLEQGGPVTIVAVGSSSTSGIGASSPDHTYPSRLEAELRQRFPKLDIHVVNRGKGGEDAPEELARLATDVVALKPDLAIWQVGTNALLRRDDLAADAKWLREGIELLKKNGIDVVLMDLQSAPHVLDRPNYTTMQDLIAETANDMHVGLFRRFALMRYWERTRPADAPAMIGPDGLHMTDAGYGCLATNLAASLEANWRADAKLAHGAHHVTDRVAGLPAHPSTAPRDMVPPSGEMRRNDANPFN